MAIQFKHIHNPLEEDLIVEYLQSDNTFIQNRKEDFKNFTNQYFPKQSIFMTLKQQYTNLAYLITKNAIVATVLMLLALTTVSAAAAELVAPTEYKPSTLLQPKSSQVEKPVAVSSSSSSVSSKSSETSVSSTTSNSSQNSSQAKLIYTNPNFPNLKLDYTGWQMKEEIIDTNNSGTDMINLSFSKNNGVVSFTLSSDYSGGGGGMMYITGYKQLSTTLARQRTRSVEWQYKQQLSPNEIIPSQGCTTAEDEKDLEFKKPEDIYCGSHPNLLFEGWTAEANPVGKPVYTITYIGPDSLLPEVDQMVLNSGLKF